MTSQYITQLFLFFVFIRYIIGHYLDTRNKRFILKNRAQVPEKFKDQITLEDHQKAADYSVAKINTSNYFNFFNTLILLGWTYFGGLNVLDKYIRSLSYGPYTQGLALLGAFALISMILGLPESLYSTFVLEEKYGFNKTTPKTFITDMIKGIIITVILGAPLILGILWIMEELSTYWWIYAWTFLTLFQIILMWAYPTFIAPLFNKFAPLEEGDVKNKVLDLLERTDFKSKGLFVMDASRRSSHGNAYFTGFGKNKRIVFFDNLIKTLEPEEVEAVLAHELGHFKKKHVLKGLAKSLVFSLIGFGVLGYVYNLKAFYLGHGVENPSDYMALLLFSLVSGAYTFLLTPLSAITSRKHEFEADEFASKNAKASKLISALVKLYKDNASTLTPDPLYSAFYHSHPPALIRVQYLEGLIVEKKGE